VSRKLYTFEEINSLIKNGDSEKVELKLRLPSEEIIAQKLAAFANTAGGLFIIGATPAGTVVGEPPEEAARAKERIERVTASLIPGRIEQVTNVVSANGQVLTLAEVRPPSAREPS
jgi:ATP-dependent DNA helicase RecG